MNAIRLLHFADAHIDMANYGRHDPVSGLPYRVLDFLKALDQIVERAISEHVDLVIFAGDAYKDRTPTPTFQREWGKRIMRLSQAGIETILLVGNHDLSPAIGRAHALQEFETLGIPHIHVAGQPFFFQPKDLNGLPVQVLALPWVNRSSLVAKMELSTEKIEDIHQKIENILSEMFADWLDRLDPDLPVILTAHATVQGATYGGERSIMLGSDLVLPKSLLADPRLDYVALGHIHKYQDLNAGQHPPVIYPGSIERVDAGEIRDGKYFILAEVARQKTSYQKVELHGRPFLDFSVSFKEESRQALPNPEDLNRRILNELPPAEELKDAIVRLTIEYPRDWEALIDEPALRSYCAAAFDLHLIRRGLVEARLRLSSDEQFNPASSAELLKKYWDIVKINAEEQTALEQLSQEIIASVSASEIDSSTQP
jgi:exonuclease SbcD